MDADEQFGQPIVSNGLPLTKIHHAAFYAHLIGVDPDYRIHVSDRLLEIHDGPFLELGLRALSLGGGNGSSCPKPDLIDERSNPGGRGRATTTAIGYPTAL
jgi:hypothetical protein